MESRSKAFGHSIHPMLIVFPLGLFVAAVVFDVLYLVTGNAAFATVAFWNIAGGIIGGLLAAVFGQALGDAARLFVDANGAYSVKQAIWQAARFAEQGVTYFEEPVSSDHLDQLAFVRGQVPAQIQVAPGEYGYDPWYFRRLLEPGAVDISQADATCCLGITGFMQAATLAYAFSVPFSAHTAPSIHAHAACAAPQLEHVEYFHDHVRIEQMLFDDVLQPHNGVLKPDGSRPGLGLESRGKDAEKWRII